MNPVVYTVKQFNELINIILTEKVGEVTICGEVSGYQIRQNKWVSFDLKDEGSVINCFTTTYQLDFPIADGQEVLVTGTPRIYVPYGKYSLNVRSVQLKGEGALKKAFDDLKAKLEKEGLFAPHHKQVLPQFPESIGIITSGEGAAVNDIRKVINGRWGGLKLYLAPVLVQGKNAPDELVGALNYFNQHHPVDVIIFGRGGGSLEDLQAFNSERVARAIFSSRIPIISGIGHEHNTSIADLVADVRAATPSNAAEIAVPDRKEIQRQLAFLSHKAVQTVEQKFQHARHSIDQSKRTLQLFVQGRMTDIRVLISRLRQLAQERRKLIARHSQSVTTSSLQLKRVFVVQLNKATQQLSERQKLLTVLNPTGILKRGYSITYQADSGKPITHLAEVPPDGKIRTQVSDGTFESSTHTRNGSSQPSLF